eukprot:738798-Pyramimonas_sp.AAC.1
MNEYQKSSKRAKLSLTWPFAKKIKNALDYSLLLTPSASNGTESKAWLLGYNTHEQVTPRVLTFELVFVQDKHA